MDTKRLLTAFLVTALLLTGWFFFMDWLYTKNNWSRAPQQATTQPADEVAGTDAPAITGATGSTTQPAQVSAVDGLQVASAEVPLNAQIGSDEHQANNPLRMQLTVSPFGAGLDEALLNEFDKTVEHKGRYTFQHPLPAGPDASRPLATTSLVVNGVTYDLAGKVWAYDAVQSSATLAVFSIDLVEGGKPAVRVTKAFELRDRSHQSLGYETVVKQTVTNLTDSPITVASHFNGMVPPVREMQSQDDRQIIAGYLDEKRFVSVAPHAVASFNKDRVTQDFTKDSEGRSVTWFGASSVYFNAIIHPEKPELIAKLTSRALNPGAAADQLQIATAFETTVQTIAAGATDSTTFTVFLGPKKRDVLLTPYYDGLPRAYGKTLGTMGAGCGNWCTFPWLINGLVWMLGVFYTVTRDWGLAIICLVILVRVLLHPITKKSTISMHKMSKMAPEIERLKKKYGDNKEELNKAMIEVYKQQGATPILGCLPMLLQMPIWVALWSALSNTFQLRQEPFLWGWTWINDLSAPDRAIVFSNPLPLLFGYSLHSINVLPFLLAIVFYMQQKFMPQPPTMTPEQAQQRKMMLWMSVLLFPLFLYASPSGLVLYILTSTTIGILEQKRIRAHIEEREAQEKLLEPEVVDAGVTRGGKFAARDKQWPKADDTPRKGIGGMMARLQQKLEEVQKQQEMIKKNKNKKK